MPLHSPPLATQPVSAASLPLPAAAATDAKLDSIIALLTTIAGSTANIKANSGATGLIATLT